MQGISTLIRTPDEVNARLAVVSTDVLALAAFSRRGKQA